MIAPHFNQTPERIENAARLRRSMTEEEVMLWSALRSFRKYGHAFRRQAPVGPYVADFLCRKNKLIIEVDGRHHDEPSQIKHDAIRDSWLQERGYTVFRVSAYEVRTELDSILASISEQIGANV